MGSLDMHEALVIERGNPLAEAHGVSIIKHAFFNACDCWPGRCSHDGGRHPGLRAGQARRQRGGRTLAMGPGALVCSRMVTVEEGAKSTPSLNRPCGVSIGANAKCSMRAGRAGVPPAAPGRPRAMRYCSAMPPERSLCRGK